MKRLGVNIDHVATVRNARGEVHPDPITAAKFLLNIGVDSITIHLREDRRHIKDLDAKKICLLKKVPVNLEISTNKNIIKIRTSLFINPNISDIKISKNFNVDCVEIHTGRLSNLVKSGKNYQNELNKIKKCSKIASNLGLEVHAGHGLDYKTTKILTKINSIKEFNIGHFIIGESIFFGLKKVIKRFKNIIK